MKTNIKALLAAIALVANTQTLHAESATWNLNPVNSDWNTAENWTPAIVPTDTATFDVSNMTDISVTSDTTVNTIIFNPGASEFSIRTDPAVNQSGLTLIITGGITNDSGVAQSFVAGVDAAGHDSVIRFTGNATTSGSLTTFMSEASPLSNLAYGGSVTFWDTSSAGDSTYHNKGAALKDALAGLTTFYSSATAANGTFINDGGTASGANGGVTWFFNSSNAGKRCDHLQPGHGQRRCWWHNNL